MDYDHLLSSRTGRLGANAIREILKVASRPGMVSLAGGIPAPESFPMETIEDLGKRVVDKYGSRAFQYDPTEGFPPLREALSVLLSGRGLQATADNVYVTSGSQGALDALGKILINPGDLVAVEAPTYLGALSAFNPYEPRYVRMETDAHGLLPDSLEQILETQDIKFVYLVPTFQNPTGRTLSLDRRKRVARILEHHGALLVEDDPYSALRYRGKALPPISMLAPENTVYVSTLSKIFAPGLRVGFFVAPPLISRWLVLVKQGVDLHTSTYTQALAAEYITGGHLERHLPNILDLYRPRQEAFLKALGQYLPKGFRWSEPEGGMFIWAEGPKGLDAEALYWKAIDRNIAFVPGKYFFTTQGEGMETMRLNFTMADIETLTRAVRTLGDVLEEELSAFC